MVSLGFESKNQTIFQLIADLDEDGSGQIEFNEFLHLMTASPDVAVSKANIRKIFNLFDDDRTDSISLANLRRVADDLAETIDEQELTEMIKRADDNEDMTVSFDEFYHIVTARGFFKNRKI